MATILQQRPVVVHGGRIKWYPCTASRTWYAGQFLYLSSYGRLYECSSAASVTCGMAADNNAADAVGTMHPVYVPDEDTVFEMNVYHSTPASATTTISLVGNTYNYFGATYWGYCNRALQTVPFFKVQALSPKDAANDLFGRVYVTVVPEVAQVGTTLA